MTRQPRARVQRPVRMALVSMMVAGAVLPAGVPAQTIAITGGTVFPVSGPKIDRGTVLIRDGKIAAVGGQVVIPADAQRIDATGKWVTPGLIFAGTNLGLGVRGLGAFQEGSVRGEINAAFNPLEGLDPEAVDIPVARTGGVTTVVLTPGGGLVAGQAAAVDLAGARVPEMLVRSPAALVIDLTSGSKEAGGGSRAGVTARLRRLFDDAREYATRKADYQRAAIQQLSAPAADLEALGPYLRGELPVVFQANRQMDIENALVLAKQYRLKAVIAGGIEAWKAAADLAAAKVPVIVSPNTSIPTFDGLGARLDNATLLRQAGVEVVIASQDPGGERNQRFGAGNAVRNGLTWDDALRAITMAPARAMGLAGYGVLEPGAVANVVVWSGDPLDFPAAAERVFIRGREASLRTRETELLERYRTLPPQ